MKPTEIHKHIEDMNEASILYLNNTLDTSSAVSGYDMSIGISIIIYRYHIYTFINIY